MDSIVIANSSSDASRSDFVKKDWIYVNDMNNGSYNGQIRIDGASLSNSGRWVNYSEGYLMIPLVLGLYAEKSRSILLPESAADEFFMGLKSGFWQILHNMSVELNGSNMVQQVAFLNVYSAFKNLTSWSWDDLQNHAATCGFYPDTPDTWKFDALHGVTNNSNTPVVPGTTVTANKSADSKVVKYNEGFRKRQSWINYTTGVADTMNQSLLLTKENAQRIFKTYVDYSTEGKRVIRMIAKIRLKDVCDFFGKLPLHKGSAITITMNMNSARTELEILNPATSAYKRSIEAKTVIVPNNGANPLQLASVAECEGGDSIADRIAPSDSVTAKFLCTLSVVRNTVANSPTYVSNEGDATALTACRLYVPAYTFDPISEQSYLSDPIKEVVYRDIQFNSYVNLAGGSNFNQLVTNGLSNLKGVLVVPFLNKKHYGSKFESYQSPFNTAGATPDPIAITDFNIQVSGQNLFQNAEVYDYEQFLFQLQSSNQANGNLTTGFTSGLIGEHEFSSGYRYYYGDCSRGLATEDGVPKAVQIQGVLACPSSISVDLMVFCEYERKVKIDVRTGAIIAE